MAKWKDSVKGILKYYEERVEGSYIEERHCSLVLHYENADDKEGASRQAGDCANHINDACESQRVHAVPSEKTVLIEQVDLSKGSAAEHIFKELEHGKNGDGGSKPDFLMVAGDDREDEVIFRWANGLAKGNQVKNVTTVSVGKRNTEAMATLTQGTTGLLSVLQKLINKR
ncbi:hypothetical protein LTS18_008124 [Coniosporium uncinatum]|uniref:Uncharacterized protein n=1 Tax=Coniosporium uncinatum TaxID=93489 RepID=A0ACC3DNX2_9PEZI|nr:hypothetical protein LTS18_008124 [Coniosporium uncinatum]